MAQALVMCKDGRKLYDRIRWVMKQLGKNRAELTEEQIEQYKGELPSHEEVFFEHASGCAKCTDTLMEKMYLIRF